MNRRVVHPRNQRMLLESVLIFGGLFALCLWTNAHGFGWMTLLAGVAQGFWFQRLYVIGHESAHRNLCSQRRLNDLLGQLTLMPLLVPINVFRAIHHFHHSANRRDPNTSAMDVFVVPEDAGPLRRFVPWVVWYIAVFGGGWFLHSLVSVFFFLALPPSVARKVSPAFNRWKISDQARASGGFGLGVMLHLSVVLSLGASAWWVALGFPFLVFAWVYSVQFYICHYRTSMGPNVLFHARSVRASGLVRWWLLNLPVHASHHRRPSIPWFELQRDEDVPLEFQCNISERSWIRAILDQLAGPTLVTASDDGSA